MDKLTKLHRSHKHRMVAGVMGGIADVICYLLSKNQLKN